MPGGSHCVAGIPCAVPALQPFCTCPLLGRTKSVLKHKADPDSIANCTSHTLLEGGCVGQEPACCHVVLSAALGSQSLLLHCLAPALPCCLQVWQALPAAVCVYSLEPHSAVFAGEQQDASRNGPRPGGLDLGACMWPGHCAVNQVPCRPAAPVLATCTQQGTSSTPKQQ